MGYVYQTTQGNYATSDSSSHIFETILCKSFLSFDNDWLDDVAIIYICEGTWLKTHFFIAP